VPFYGLAIVDSLSGIRTQVVDPFETSFIEQQPTVCVLGCQCAIVDEMARELRQI
jgi:hypothetical protein